MKNIALVKKVLFRADANTKLGLGDLMSLINLSEFFVEKGWFCYFITKNYNEAISLTQKRNIQNITFIPFNISLEDEEKKINQLIELENIDLLFFSITEKLFSDYQNINKNIQKVCIHYSGWNNQYCSILKNIILVVDYDEKVDHLYKQDNYINTEFFLGSKYVILPKNFYLKNLEKKENKLKKILITLGGGDELNITQKVVNVLIKAKLQIKICIIVGSGYKFLEELEKSLKDTNLNYKIKHNVKNMLNEYMSCDIGIGAGGLTSAELIATKTSTLLIAAVEHQIERCAFFDKNGYAKYLGYRTFKEEELIKYIENPLKIKEKNLFNRPHIIDYIFSKISSEKKIEHSKTTLDDTDKLSVLNVLNSGFITSGQNNLLFRKKISQYLGKEYVFLYSSGAMALFFALRALDLKGKDILLPTYTCPSVFNASKKAGMGVQLYDNSKNSWLASGEDIATYINKDIKAILITHIYGIRVNNIEKLKEYSPILIEDCAHAFVSSINGKSISNNSLCSIYSFNATKLLATGEGGVIATDDREFAKELEKFLIDYGLSDINCSLGISQLDKFDGFLEKRKEIADFYKNQLGNIAMDIQNYDSIYFRFPILSDKSDKFFSEKSNVAYRKGVDRMLHKEIGSFSDNFINADNVYKKTVSIPIYPSLTKKEIQFIVDDVKRIYEL